MILKSRIRKYVCTRLMISYRYLNVNYNEHFNLITRHDYANGY